MHYRLLQEINDLLDNIELTIYNKLQDLMLSYRAMSYEEMKLKLEENDTETLHFLSKKAEKNEHYEICQAIQEILNCRRWFILGY